MPESLKLASGETVRCELRFESSGFLALLIRFLGPLLKADRPEACWITDRRVVKRVAGGKDHELAIGDIGTAFWNTSSNSFALVAKSGDKGLLVPLVSNAKEAAAALAAAGVRVEEESASPRRRFLE